MKTADGKSISLKRQAGVRLVLALSVAMTVTMTSALWYYNVSFEKAAQQKNRDAVDHYTVRIGQLENEWESEALRLKARLEFTRLLEDREQGWVKLSSYFIAQSGSPVFSNILISSGKGQVLFRYGIEAAGLPEETNRITLHREGYVGWYYNAPHNALYRVYRQTVWLGKDGMGWLYLFRPLDNALLYANIFPGARLFLSWRGTVIAASTGDQRKPAVSPSYEGALYLDDQRYEQRRLSWEGKNARDLSLIIQQRVERPFTIQEFVRSSVLMVLSLSTFLWLVLGSWLSRIVRRTIALRDASLAFSGTRAVTPEIALALDKARLGSTDELSDVARAIDDLMHTVKRGDADMAVKITELTRLNTELSEFTYIASHDLQEPLRKLVIFSEWLVRDLGGDIPERAAKDLVFISEAAQRMRNLVQDLLNLSRAGNRELKTESISLDMVADRALESLALRIEDSGAVITRDPLPTVMGDATLLTQLYQNLIGNALKYAGESPPRIHLDASMAGGEWVLGVRDNGIGINPAYAEQIFQPFKRLHGRERFEGTGIGLAICRKVVERCHGRIWVESEEGKGAHFRFALPCKP
ncbi:MAG: ATP-binding protein [Sulfuricellaceae bacterium]